jgi:hypothetical protein
MREVARNRNPTITVSVASMLLIRWKEKHKVCASSSTRFHVVELLPMTFHKEPCVTSENVWWSINKIEVEYQTSLDILDRKCMFVNLWIEYIGHPRCVHYWVWSSWSYCNRSPKCLHGKYFLTKVTDSQRKFGSDRSGISNFGGEGRQFLFIQI